jgi:predicted amidohydrolase YtcJ
MNIKQKIVGFFVACCSFAAVANTSTVYFNGEILTMQGDSPQYVEALVAQNTLGVNLGYFSKNPPNTKTQAINKLRTEGKPFNGWILSSGYSAAMLSDGGLSLADLDKAFPDQPLLLQNISTLAGQLNTAGLKKLGITKDTKAVGGFISVDPKTGELTGELIGAPYMDAVARSAGKYSQAVTFDIFRKAEQIFLSNGFTTAQSYEATADAGIDMTLSAITKAIKETGTTENRRTVISHSFFARDDQIKQYKEESAKGALAKGMLADLVILDRNPLKAIPDDLKNIEVLHTIKHGKRLYSKK